MTKLPITSLDTIKSQGKSLNDLTESTNQLTQAFLVRLLRFLEHSKRLKHELERSIGSIRWFSQRVRCNGSSNLCSRSSYDGESTSSMCHKHRYGLFLRAPRSKMDLTFLVGRQWTFARTNAYWRCRSECSFESDQGRRCIGFSRDESFEDSFESRSTTARQRIFSLHVDGNTFDSITGRERNSIDRRCSSSSPVDVQSFSQCQRELFAASSSISLLFVSISFFDILV